MQSSLSSKISRLWYSFYMKESVLNNWSRILESFKIIGCLLKEWMNEQLNQRSCPSTKTVKEKEWMLLTWAWPLHPLTHKALFSDPCHYLVREGCFLIQVSSASGPNVKENADINIPWKTQEKLPFPRDSLCGRGVNDSRFWLWFWCHGWLSPSLVKAEDLETAGVHSSSVVLMTHT